MMVYQPVDAHQENHISSAPFLTSLALTWQIDWYIFGMFLKHGTFDKMDVKVPRRRRMKESPVKRTQVQLAIFCWVEQEGEGEEKEGDKEDGDHLEPASHWAAQTHTSAKRHWGLRPLLKGGIQTHTTSQTSLLHFTSQGSQAENCGKVTAIYFFLHEADMGCRV